jgi:hypothetical protein
MPPPEQLAMVGDHAAYRTGALPIRCIEHDDHGQGQPAAKAVTRPLSPFASMYLAQIPRLPCPWISPFCQGNTS